MNFTSFRLNVKNDPTIRIPKIGDKVMVTNFDLLPNHVVREITKKGDIIEVTDITQITFGEHGDYHYEYEIDADELDDYFFGPRNYKFIN